jgi:hypothetical protein
VLGIERFRDTYPPYIWGDRHPLLDVGTEKVVSPRSLRLWGFDHGPVEPKTAGEVIDKAVAYCQKIIDKDQARLEQEPQFPDEHDWARRGIKSWSETRDKWTEFKHRVAP